MDDRWLICVKKHHPLGYLFRYANSSPPRQRHLGFMQNIEKCCPITVLANDIEIIIVLGHPDHRHQLRMMPNFHRSHNFSFEFLLSIRWADVIFYFLDGHLSTSPFAFEDFWRVAKPNFLLEFERRILNNVLLCALLDLLDDETLEVNKTIALKSFLSNVDFFYFRNHLLFLLYYFLLLG